MSGPITYRGTLYPQEQSFEYDYDPSTGGKRTIEFDTFSETNAVALANANILNRVPTKYRLVHGNATVVVSDSNFPSIDTWQLLANESSKSRWDAPAMLRIMRYGNGTTFYGDLINYLKSSLDNRSPWSTIVGVSFGPSSIVISDEITGSDLAYLSKVYNLILRGSDSYPYSQYVLRHSTNVGNNYNVNIADSRVDRVYTVSQLLTETQDSALWVFPLPGEMQYVIQHIAQPADQAGYLWGWLKRSSTRQTAAFNRIELTTEYWLEQWEQTQLGNFFYAAYA